MALVRGVPVVVQDKVIEGGGPSEAVAVTGTMSSFIPGVKAAAGRAAINANAARAGIRSRRERLHLGGRENILPYIVAQISLVGKARFIRKGSGSIRISVTVPLVADRDSAKTEREGAEAENAQGVSSCGRNPVYAAITSKAW